MCVNIPSVLPRKVNARKNKLIIRYLDLDFYETIQDVSSISSHFRVRDFESKEWLYISSHIISMQIRNKPQLSDLLFIISPLEKPCSSSPSRHATITCPGPKICEQLILKRKHEADFKVQRSLAETKPCRYEICILSSELLSTYPDAESNASERGAQRVFFLLQCHHCCLHLRPITPLPLLF